VKSTCAARGKRKRSVWVASDGATIKLSAQGRVDGEMRWIDVELSVTGAQGVIDKLALAIYEIEEQTARGRRQHEDYRRQYADTHDDLDQG